MQAIAHQFHGSFIVIKNVHKSIIASYKFTFQSRNIFDFVMRCYAAENVASFKAKRETTIGNVKVVLEQEIAEQNAIICVSGPLLSHAATG